MVFRGPFFLDSFKRNFKMSEIGTCDLSDILGHKITFYFTLRCGADFFDFRVLPNICHKLLVFRQKKTSKITGKKSKKTAAVKLSLKSYIMAQNFRKIVFTRIELFF